mmetsp:Transcript_19483/g.44356  ORF Transcript_19483/g.44356 Transcript_19483/m.44356 type:complete len:619 (-) Transcript_19483:42-1898(-)
MTKQSPSVLDKLIETKDDFRSHRYDCLRYPDRAIETLTPIAYLEISIVSARRLSAWTQSHTFQTPSSPFAKVFLDDRKAFETTSIRSANPQWSKKGRLGITAPHSMVRVQVLDYDSITHTEDIGFVEFCVVDIPFDKQIDGWLELRLSDLLERTSTHRYIAHRSGRDDEVDERHEARQGLLNPGCTITSCNRGPMQVQRNAGEVLVRLKLRREGTWLDTAFSLALDPPPPKNFGIRKKEKPTDTLPMWDVQDLRDDITDIKMAVVEGAVASTTNFIGYILTWRSSCLSACLAGALITTWCLPVLTWVIIPAVLAFVLVLLSSEQVRRATTLGGVNAPLSQEGFEKVAGWRSKASMVRFVRRVVEQDLQGKVADEGKLTVCAANIFAHGVPKISYQQLRDGLRDAQWVAATKDELAPGALVVVSSEEGNQRARVQKVLNTGEVTVKYDNGVENAVRSFSVTPRPMMPSVPAWIVPNEVGKSLRSIEIQISDTKKSLLVPIEKISKVLTWRWPVASFSLTIFLLLVSATEATILVGIWGDLPGALGDQVTRAAGAAMDFVKAVFQFTVLACGVLFLIHRSPPFVILRSLVKVGVRLLTMRRSAPRNWPFFRETGAMNTDP